MNKVEQIKQEKDGLDVWEDIFRYAEQGFDAITEDDLTRLRWYGIYQQRPNNGHFMLRVRIPGGVLTSAQAAELAALARDRGRGFCDITTRQDIQFHWLTIADMAEVLPRLAGVGLTTKEACGDVTRNITGCPLHGVNADEIIDPTPLIERIGARILNDDAFSNLPRKFKICISGCPAQCAKPEINDLGLLAVKHPETGVVGYNVTVGGGLSTQPRFARNLDAWVTEDQAVDLAVAVTEIFRDDGYRVSRHRARLKYLVDDWGPEEFRARLQVKLPFTLSAGVPMEWEDTYEDHIGIRPQSQRGLFSLGITVLVGRISAEQLAAASDVAGRFGQGRLRTTLGQNLIVLDVAGEDVAEASRVLADAGLTVGAGPVERGAVTCTGIEFCNLAVVETKERMREIVSFVGANAAVDSPFRMQMNGCPNSCGQHHIADIGFQGGRVKIDGQVHECFDISVGGGLGNDRAFTHTIRRKVLAEDAKTVVANLMNAYTERRETGESFKAFIRRNTDEDLAAYLGGTEIPADAEVMEG
ncbi:MAG TPA: nitrite/sulfite reductase [Armatimonadota bacterium]|jgi:sulfite reductase beta subunit-like hemoprotein